MTICDICDQNVTISVVLKNFETKKIRACDQGHKFQIVTFCDRHKFHIEFFAYTVSVSVWNTDRNDSQFSIKTLLSHFLSFLSHRFNVGPDPYQKGSITGN